MNLSLLREHIEKYKANLKADPQKYAKDLSERTERTAYYQAWTADKLSNMTEEELYEYLTKLWAMLIWGHMGTPFNYLITHYAEIPGRPHAPRSCLR